MAIRNLRRQATNPLAAPGTPTTAPIYVDSDDNILKMIPAGSGTSEVSIVDGSSAQTLTNKTLTAPVITGAMTVAAGATFTQPSIVQLAETVAATNVLTAAESGKVCFLSHATEFATTLPAPAAGLNFDFFVAAAPSGASYTVVTDAAAQVLAGKVVSVAGDAGDVENAATATTITFVDGQSVIGDYAKVWSDGTSWFAICVASVAAGITITG